VSSFVEAAIEIATEAGELISGYVERRIGFELKGEYDLVTAADRASEGLIVQRLHQRFPDHAVVGEEGGRVEGASEYCWYVDPLDGTTNFAHGFPHFAVSMGLERAGELIAGVIVDPMRREVFAAEKGAGATLNRTPIRVSKAARLTDALTATGYPSRKRHRDINIHFFYQLSIQSHGVRRAGAAALDLAYVAAGRLDLFWEFGLNSWDTAAGTLIVRESGGTVTGMHGEPFTLHSPNILADNGLLHGPALQVFADVFAGRYRQQLPEL
jgi:myo-inositol-1(or 4)-monophosphatase